jgi:HSP20 family molecular chaperone IbpA
MTPQSPEVFIANTIKLNPVSQDELLELTGDLFDSISRRAYELYERRGGAPDHESADWFGAQSQLLSPLKLDILEWREDLIARAEVPGFDPHEIKVHIAPRSLTIFGKAEVTVEHKYSLLRPRRFFCVTALPVEVDPDNAKVTLTGSTLEVVMSKAAADAELRVA